MSEPLIKTPCVFGETGNFLLERELGNGGMGGVYMGRDKMLDRPVAVKVMQKELGADAEFVEKFKKEAQLAARLIHPNIAQIYAYGFFDGMPYIVMELAAGGSLYSIMKANSGKTDVARVLKICQQVAQALQCAADQGCVHGDVKPENVLLDSNGNAKLVDFGLAAMQKDTSEIWGTPYYISPEKVKKEPVDFRADMYSLGGTLYHALTGVAPFEGDDSIAVVKKRFEGAPRRPSEIRPDLTPVVDRLVMKMLALKKEDRYPSFESLIEAFRSVLSTGLSKSAEGGSAVSGQRSLSSGGLRRPLLRTKRLASAVTTQRPAAFSAKPKPAAAAVPKGRLLRRRRTEVPELPVEEEEEGGGLGAKVFGAVVGIILLVGAVIGGLVWYKVADAKARAADDQAQINTGIASARESIAATLRQADAFANEREQDALKAEAECQKPTDEIRQMIPEEQGKLLKPGPTRELLDAIASTNEVDEASLTNGVAGVTNALGAVTNANVRASATNAVNAAAATSNAVAAAAGDLPKFPEPNEDQKDPQSPEGETYLKARKAYYENVGKNPEAAKAALALVTGQKTEGGDEKAAADGEATGADGEKAGAVEAAKPAAPANEFEDRREAVRQEAEKVKAGIVQDAVRDMNELWERVYGCQACAVRIRHEVRQLLKKGVEADELKGQTKAVAETLGALSIDIAGKFESIKGSKDYDTLRKGMSFVKSKGDNVKKKIVRELRRITLESGRKIRAIDDEEQEKLRLQKKAEAKKALIEKETAEAKAKFAAIVTQGCFRQLDWKSAERMLNALKSDFTSPEGQLAVDFELRKVANMKMVQDIFLKNLKGHVFVKFKLKGYKVEEVNDKEIVLSRPNSQQKQRIPWQKFYNGYHGNFNEIINAYIVNARLPNASPKVKIDSLLEWANAMAGAAMTMQLVCSEANGAITRSEELLKKILEQFPDYEKTIREMFPGTTIEAPKENE